MIINPYQFPAAGGGFIPTDIAGCKLWIDAESLGLSDGDPISTFTDLSGNGNSPTSYSGTDPVWKPSIANSRAGALFSENGSLKKSFTLNAPSTWFMVTKCSGNAVVGRPPADGANNLSANFYRYNATLKPYSSGFGAPVSIDWTAVNVICQIWDGSSSLTSINGVVTSQSGMGASANPGGVTLGSWGNGSEYYGGYLLGGSIHDSNLGTSDREQMEDYFGALFGVTITH